MSYLWLKLYADVFGQEEITDILSEACAFSTLNKINVELDVDGIVVYIVPYTTLQLALDKYWEKKNEE